MILLDTHVLIWLRLNSPQLNTQALQLINKHWQLGQVYVSAITFWETAMLRHKGRLEFAQDIDAWRKELLGQGLTRFQLVGK